MRCEPARGHEAILAGLWNAAREGRLAHALCFSGPEGVGKFLAAERLAFGLCCASGPGEPCGSCGPCKRLASGTHADVFVIDAQADDEEQILISRIVARPEKPQPNVTEFLSLKPMEGGWRIVLMREADRMNRESQNALLKTLEEPGDKTLLVLETSFQDRLLATTHSRCVRVEFAPLARELAASLLEERGVAAADARQLARWTGGAPGAALAARSRGLLEQRELLARALRGELEPPAVVRELYAIEAELPGKTPAAVSRARARAFLDLVLAVLADARRHAVGLDAEELAHGDLASELALGARRLAELLEDCLAARQDVDLNLAPEAALERALSASCGAAARGAGRASSKS